MPQGREELIAIFVCFVEHKVFERGLHLRVNR